MTAVKREKLRQRRLDQRTEVQSRWHTAFAWHPLLTEDGYWVWLETVHRCRKHRFSEWRYLSDIHNTMTVADDR